MSEPHGVRRYLAVDNETGGFEGTSLLTSYLAVLDSDMNILGELDLAVRPDNGIYCVEAGGLAVNKINLIEHDKIALSYSEAGKRLREFLLAWSLGGEIKLIPFGHNVTFDVIGLRVLLSRANLEQYTSYRKFDTAVIAQFLKFCGKIPEDVSGSLGSLATYFNIDADPATLHTAKGDVIRTIAVAKAMKAL
jgi:hypothetical protein